MLGTAALGIPMEEGKVLLSHFIRKEETETEVDEKPALGVCWGWTG